VGETYKIQELAEVAVLLQWMRLAGDISLSKMWSIPYRLISVSELFELVEPKLINNKVAAS
jgi:hypothetical protein